MLLTCPTVLPTPYITFSGTDNGYVLVWNLTTQTIIDTTRCGESSVLSVITIKSWSNSDRTWLVVYTREQKLMVLVWNVRECKLTTVAGT